MLALINIVCVSGKGGYMFTPINTMCMLGKGTVFIIAVRGKGRSKQQLALINTLCMCGNGRFIASTN